MINTFTRDSCGPGSMPSLGGPRIPSGIGWNIYGAELARMGEALVGLRPPRQAAKFPAKSQCSGLSVAACPQVEPVRAV
jgi:hypothetical protein